MYPGWRICAVFQPHQVSRTACLLDELAASLDNSDRLYVAEIFPAPRARVAAGGDHGVGLAARLRRRGKVVDAVHALPAIFECSAAS